jgi:hypothetical protein
MAKSKLLDPREFSPKGAVCPEIEIEDPIF